MPKIEVSPRIVAIAEAIAGVGGRALVVGGYVRDALLGVPSKDLDIEVLHLELPALEAVLRRFGAVETFGRSFGVMHVKGLGVDFSLPRRDSKVRDGHRGFEVALDPHLSFAEASRRRDLTINSIGLDVITGELLDPHGGRQDLAAKTLRATDVVRFADDPLRGLRVAQFAARFAMQPDPELVALCAALDLSELSPERIFEEMRKLLLGGIEPSVGLSFLRRTGLLRFFPQLAALVGVPQDPQWHPEGDVWQHTLMVVDQAAALRDGGGDDLALMLGALCHDLGKPETTVDDGDHIRSPEHDTVGVEITAQLLGAMRAPKALIAQVCALVQHHLAPSAFVKTGASAKGYRRLARKLEAVEVSLALLVRVARADHFGRLVPEALAHRFPAGDTFLEQARTLLVERHAPRDVVMGRHLIAGGMTPSVEFGDILRRCREIQDETGWDDPEQILDAVLGR